MQTGCQSEPEGKTDHPLEELTYLEVSEHDDPAEASVVTPVKHDLAEQRVRIDQSITIGRTSAISSQYRGNDELDTGHSR